MSSDSAINFLGLPIRKIISPLNHAHIGIVTYDLRIDGIDMTFTKRKIIYGIEQIGFPHAIVADKTIIFGDNSISTCSRFLKLRMDNC